MAKLSGCLKSYGKKDAFLSCIITVDVLVSKEMSSGVNTLAEVFSPLSIIV